MFKLHSYSDALKMPEMYLITTFIKRFYTLVKPGMNGFYVF